MRPNRFFRSLLAAVAAATLGFAGATTARADDPDPQPSLAWLADAIESGDATVEFTATDQNGNDFPLSDNLREEVLSFVKDALRNGRLPEGDVFVMAMDEAGNIIYSGTELPENLDELIGMLCN